MTAITCELCKERPASVFQTLFIQGEKFRRNLCESCAKPLTDEVFRGSSIHDIPPAGSGIEIPERPPGSPVEVMLSEANSIPDLARAMNIQPFLVIAILMRKGIFCSVKADLDFTTASIVCKHYGVIPLKSP